MFCGIGINTPVLHYMMDALAAYKPQGETTQPNVGGYAYYRKNSSNSTGIFIP